jgi:two-component system, OmpR family, sensor kinase
VIATGLPDDTDDPVLTVEVARDDVARRGAESDASRAYRHTTVREVSRFLGLGLFIARAVVSAHGGNIQVRSSADAGTTFTVALPKAPSSPAPA